jgi:hypothetical protein
LVAAAVAAVVVAVVAVAVVVVVVAVVVGFVVACVAVEYERYWASQHPALHHKAVIVTFCIEVWNDRFSSGILVGTI